MISSVAPKAKKRKLLYQNEYDLERSITRTYIDETFTNLQLFLHSFIDPTFSGSLTSPFDSMIQKVESAKNLGQIVEACNDLEICYSEGDQIGVNCMPCSKAGENGGWFQFTKNDEEATGSKGQPIQAKRFRKLKFNIKKHLLSHTHGLHSKAISNHDKSDIVTKGYINSKVAELKLFVEALQKGSGDETAKNSSKPKSQVSACSSIDDLIRECPLLKLHFSCDENKARGEFEGIICTVCCKDMHQLSGKKKGYFHYNSVVENCLEGGQLNKPKHLPSFPHLKETIGKHLECKSHIVAAGGEYNPKPKEMERIELDKIAGMNLGRTAYKCIVKYQSKASFEPEVASLFDMNVPVGNINHSSGFVDHLFPELYSVLKERTIGVLNNPVSDVLSPSPFVVWADKITPCGTTHQIIGIILFKDGKNTPIVLDILPVKHKCQNGAALAQDIIATLLKFYSPEAAKQLYVGCAFDGQYFKLGVPKHLLILLGHCIDLNISNEVLAQTRFESASWDPAHLLELACLDVSKTKKFGWVETVEQSITSINKVHSHGKQFHRLLEMAQQQDQKFHRPGTFSETRFCTYKFKVLKNFIENYSFFFAKLSEDGDNSLNLINHCEFCIKLSGLADIFRLIGSTSTHVQSAELNPWQCDSYINTCITELDEIQFALSSETFVGNNINLKFLTAAFQEIKTKGSFMTQGIYFQHTPTNCTRQGSMRNVETSFDSVIARVLQEIAAYVAALSASIKCRYTRNHSQKTFHTSCEAFALDNIVKRDPKEIPEGFIDYCSLARESQFVKQDVPQADLNFEYIAFTKLVHSTYNRYFSQARMIPEDQFYWEIIQSEDSRSCKNVLDLLVSAIVRNKSECVAESIGSIIKEHLDKRVNLTDANLGCEVFLHFNGPYPNRDCDGLVRQALNRMFGGEEWHLTRRSHPSDLKPYEASKVVDRIHNKSGRIIVPDTKVD